MRPPATRRPPGSVAPCRERGVAQLASGSVDSDACARPWTSPVARHATACRHAVSRTKSPIRVIRPLSSAIGMNSSGSDGTEAPVVPAGQGLELRHPSGGQTHDRLVLDGQLVAVERAAQFLDISTRRRVWASSASSNSEIVDVAFASRGPARCRLGGASRWRERIVALDHAPCRCDRSAGTGAADVDRPVQATRQRRRRSGGASRRRRDLRTAPRTRLRRVERAGRPGARVVAGGAATTRSTRHRSDARAGR